jgi:hypothetical protein
VYPRPSRFAEKRLRPPIHTQDIQPAAVDLVRPPAHEPEAKKQGLVHLGGPWYLVGNEKVRGKKAAVAKAREEGLL